MTDEQQTPDPFDELPEELRASFREWAALEEVADTLGVHAHADGIRALARFDAVVRELGNLRADVVDQQHVQMFGEQMSAEGRETIVDRIAVRVEADAVESAIPILSRDLEAITAARVAHELASCSCDPAGPCQGVPGESDSCRPCLERDPEEPCLADPLDDVEDGIFGSDDIARALGGRGPSS
jgi:hypothetical protein